jgi:hypothetical protein
MPAAQGSNMRTTILCFLAATAIFSALHAQSPMPVVVPAMTPAAKTQAPAVSAEAANVTQEAVKALQALKAANEEILKQQAAALEKLDEMEKAANELRIFSKRG